MKLKNKIAVITGGSRGIGKIIAKAFLKEGAKVVIAARNRSELENCVKEFRYIWKDSIIGVKTDVSKPDQVNNLIRETKLRFGKIDILVNAAGIQSPISPFVESKIEEWIKNIEVNLIGTMLCCRYALPFMILKRSGKIINFSGGGAISPRPNFSAYACSKTAIVRLSETLSEEIKEYKIDINTIAPGSVNTRMADDIILQGDKAGPIELKKAIEIKNKGGTPPELAADLAVFLASEASNGISGRLISAAWDDWKNLSSAKIRNSSLFTLRRIDMRKFIELKK